MYKTDPIIIKRPHGRLNFGSGRGNSLHTLCAPELRKFADGDRRVPTRLFACLNPLPRVFKSTHLKYQKLKPTFVGLNFW